MAQEYRPGGIVPQSGVYTITRDPAHADMPHEVTVIRCRRFPTCRSRLSDAAWIILKEVMSSGKTPHNSPSR